jgi:hypothetical protein
MVGRLRDRGRDSAPARARADRVVRVAEAEPHLPAGVADVVDELHLEVEGLSALLALVATVPGSVAVRSLTVEVAPWAPARRGPVPRVGRVDGVVRSSVRLRKRALVVTLAADEPVGLRALLAAVAGAASPVVGRHPGAGTASVDLVVPAAEAVPFVSTAHRLLPAHALEDERVRASDLLLVPAGAAPLPPGCADRVVVAGTAPGSCVDPAVHRPWRRRDFSLPVVDATLEDDGRLVLTADDGLVEVPTGPHGLTSSGVSVLRRFGGVRVAEPVRAAGPLRVLRQVSACGVVVSASVDPATGPTTPLAASWAEPAPTDAAGLERASVRQRRTAHRDHSTLRVSGPAPSVSLVLSTNRPDHLEAILRDVRRLDYPQLQLVLGLHGIPEPAGLDDWLEPLRERIDVTVRPAAADTPFGAVLADLSRRAEGTLLSKLDDDDHYGAEHVWDLVTAHEYSGAAVVGKGVEHVYLAGADATVRRIAAPPEAYAGMVAGGTMLLSQADLQGVGGWRPVARAVDRALLDRVIEAGGGVYRTHGFGYLYVRAGHEHTWSVEDEHFTADAVERWDGRRLPDDDPPSTVVAR